MHETSPSVWWFSSGLFGQALIRMETSLAASSWGELGKAMGALQREAEALEMRSVTAQLGHINTYISTAGPNGKTAELRAMLYDLIQRVMDEFNGERFLALSAAERGLYSPSTPLFGEAVDEAFPSASFDISEAGKCLALGLSTAAVMHLMRALEPAILTLQSAVGVDVPKTQWDQILNQIEARIRDINRRTHGADDEQWFSEAATHFRSIKNAWRNHAMHGREEYEPERARMIFDSMKGFMQHLATRLAI